ncbi:oligosaccharide flippase family protein [Acinetobacter silvestris]|uniref:Uncharacterized protein n=1 Tax=Acinetobacter silvestris TaxID=1977882 RepID=A0A1Y3CD52_9GAMM|nr:oligosaccharide flippase family protein [Acinetobacter silvestris]OTG63832.1 hypothetical protein B9T28_12640 [Acinetobacter silvestris]
MKSALLKILNNSRVRNSIWMVIEKGVAFFGLIFVVSAVAKYLGPTIYGYLALASSVFAIISVIGRLGLDQIYFKTVSKNNTKSSYLIDNMMWTMKLIYLPISLFVLCFFYFKVESHNFIYFIATAIATYLITIDLRAFHLDALLLSKFNVLANTTGLILSLIARYFIVYLKLDPQFLAIPIVLIALVPYLMRIYFFKREKILIGNRNFKVIHFKKYLNYFLKAGVPLAISMLSVSIYLQSANFILMFLEDSAAVGIYSIASMLAGAWYFIPTTIILSFLSLIYRQNDEYEYIEVAGTILRYLSLISGFIIIVLYSLASPLILWLYGPDYKQSVLVFKILLFSYFFSVWGFFFYRLVIKFGGYSFLAKKMLFTCVLNIILTYFLIQRYGVVGAAISILITEFLSNIVFNLWYPKMKMPQIVLKCIGVKK